MLKKYSDSPKETETMAEKTTLLPFSHCNPGNLAIAAASLATTHVFAAANMLPARSAGTISGDPTSFLGSLEFFTRS